MCACVCERESVCVFCARMRASERLAMILRATATASSAVLGAERLPRFPLWAPVQKHRFCSVLQTTTEKENKGRGERANWAACAKRDAMKCTEKEREREGEGEEGKP